ncbi:hypothetical protein [Amycolatopsis silviterrae]|uniref:WXG100 family type VII secretion target n=1 Tax=Amycolatopsis silviterrae TaxID=1656914 RepID=A0ABW5H3F8_9PSEU
MSGYRGMQIAAQIQIMNGTKPLQAVADQAAEMWRQAKNQLTGASRSLQQQLKALEPDWTDAAGTGLQRRGGKSVADIDSWTAGIDQAVSELGTLSAKIAEAGKWFDDVTNRLLGLLVSPEEMQRLAEQGAAKLEDLAGTFDRAAKAVTATKGNDWSGPLGSGGGGSGGAGSPGGGAGSPGGAGAGAGGQQGASGSSAGAGQGGGAQPGGAEGGDQPGQSGDQSGGLPGDQPQQPGSPQIPSPGQDPSLSGLGGASAPVAPPALPPLPPLSAPPPSLPGGLPLPMGGLGGLGGLGGGFGGAVPGVKLGGGGPKPPQPAFPLTQQAATLPSGQAPKLPEAGPAQPSGGSGGGGMPMAPMSGLGGLSGGGGGTPGSGAAQRPPSGRGPRRTNPPGLPASLRGKSGRTDPSAFAPLARASRRERADDRMTVEVLDDDLWQVTEPSAAGQTAPGRSAR